MGFFPENGDVCDFNILHGNQGPSVRTGSRDHVETTSFIKIVGRNGTDWLYVLLCFLVVCLILANLRNKTNQRKNFMKV